MVYCEKQECVYNQMCICNLSDITLTVRLVYDEYSNTYKEVMKCQEMVDK